MKMVELRYNLTPVVTVDVEGKDPNYVRTQLNKRIEAQGLSGIKVSVSNSVAYLERE
jgi:hypothetical protein